MEHYEREIRAPSGDVFDRIIGAIDGLPGVTKARPTSVTTIMPILGNSQTYVVQTYKDDDEGFYVFLQMVDAEGRARIAIPPKVAAAIYRQRESLVRAGRKRRSRERWAELSPGERRARTAHLRRAK
jgi:hypothetical protein